MTALLKNTPIKWDSEQERDGVCNALDTIGFGSAVWRRAKKDNVARTVKMRLGVFTLQYHTFEQALEVTSQDDTFRFVFGRGYRRIDGDKAALKRWLFIHKLTA